MPAGSLKTKQQASGSKTAPVTQEASPINEEVSPSGANVFEAQWFTSEKGLNNHWEDHKKNYSGLNEEQYVKKALKLVQKPTGNGILGHATVDGGVVRYNTATNDFVKGRPKRGIISMYKPDLKQKYYENERKKALERGGRA